MATDQEEAPENCGDITKGRGPALCASEQPEIGENLGVFLTYSSLTNKQMIKNLNRVFY